MDGWFGQGPPAIRQHVGVRAQTALVRSRGSHVPKPARAEAFTVSIGEEEGARHVSILDFPRPLIRPAREMGSAARGSKFVRQFPRNPALV